MNSRMDMCPKNWQMTWVWAHGTAFGKTIIPFYSTWVSRYRYICCVSNSRKENIYISDSLLLMTVLLWIMYWDWVSPQWTPQTCGTQLEGSCLRFACSTVWFGEAVNAVLLATLVRITITLTLMVFLTFIKWQKSELQRCHVLFVCGPAVTSLK